MAAAFLRSQIDEGEEAMNLKKSLCATALLAFMAAVNPCAVQAAGIPVVDAAAIGQMVTQITEMQKQYQQMLLDYEQMKQTNTNLSGVSGIGELFSNTAEALELFPDFQNEINNIASQGVNALNDKARAIYNRLNLGAKCAALDSEFKKLCEKDAAFTASRSAAYEEAQQRMTKRNEQLEDLMRQIERADSAKNIADLQARISSELGYLQIQQTKLAINEAGLQAAREALRAQEEEAVDNFFRVDADTDFSSAFEW